MSGNFFQKFNFSAGARGAKIWEGPQGPSYATGNNVKNELQAALNITACFKDA